MRIKPKLASQLRYGDNLGDRFGEVVKVDITPGAHYPVQVECGVPVIVEEHVEGVGTVKHPTYPFTTVFHFHYNDLITLHERRVP